MVGPTWPKLSVAALPVSKISYMSPSNIDELLNSNIWFCASVPIIGPEFSKKRASILHKYGMRYYRDIWEQSRFMDFAEAQAKFGLSPNEEGAWSSLTTMLYRQWATIINNQSPRICCREWLGIFSNTNNILPLAICQALETFQPCLGFNNVEIPWQTTICVAHNVSFPYVPPIAKELTSTSTSMDLRGEDMVNKYMELVRRVWIAFVSRGPKKKEILLYYGQVDKLQWDLERFVWN